MIYFFPGLAGSALGSAWPESNNYIGLAALMGQLNLLRCKPDGTPMYVTDTVVTGLQESYLNVVAQLDAFPLPYDWRMLPSINAPAMESAIVQNGAGWFVAHSYGTCHALETLRLLIQDGLGSLCQGLIFMGGPVWNQPASNGTSYRTLSGSGEFFDLLVKLASAGQVYNPIGITAYNYLTGGYFNPTANLISIASTWDCMSFLLPTTGIVRQQSFWSLVTNNSVKQAWLDRGLVARNAQQSYAQAAISGKDLYNIYGGGRMTPLINVNGAVDYTPDGDGTVATLERMPGATAEIFTSDTHMGLNDDPLVLEAIKHIVSGDTDLSDVKELNVELQPITSSATSLIPNPPPAYAGRVIFAVPESPGGGIGWPLSLLDP